MRRERVTEQRHGDPGGRDGDLGGLRAHLREHVGRRGRRVGEHAAYIDARGAHVTARMLELTGPRPGERVLELACGPGGLGFAAAELVAPGGEVVVSDVVPEMTAIAAARAAALGLTQREHARAGPGADRRARRVLRRRPVPGGADARGRSRPRGRRDPARPAPGRAGRRSRCGGRASATRGSASCSTRWARSSARRCPRRESRGRSRSRTPTGWPACWPAPGCRTWLSGSSRSPSAPAP